MSWCGCPDGAAFHICNAPGAQKGPPEPDLDYAEAKRQARALLGQSAEVNKMPSAPLMFRSRVGVWLGPRFVLIGVGETYRAALEDVKHRQKLLEDAK